MVNYGRREDLIKKNLLCASQNFQNNYYKTVEKLTKIRITKGLIGPLYILILFGLPFLTFSGWGFYLFIPLVLIPGIILLPFVLREFHRDAEWSFKWILWILIIFSAGCLLVIDGADGPARLGIETLISRVFGIDYYAFTLKFFIFSKLPGPIFDHGDNLGGILFIIFLILNIVYILRSKKRGKNILNLTSTVPSK